MASGKILNLSEFLLPYHAGKGPGLVLPLSSRGEASWTAPQQGLHGGAFPHWRSASLCEMPAAWLAQGWVLRGLEKSSDASALSSKCSLGEDGDALGHFIHRPS